MKYLILIFAVFFSISALAQKKATRSNVAAKSTVKTLAEINFSNRKAAHKYLLMATSGLKPQYRLQFSESPRKYKTKVISEGEAKAIKKDITALIWQSEYRKPASSTPCREFARLKTSRESTTVCQQNRGLSMRSYALLTSLHKKFE